MSFEWSLVKQHAEAVLALDPENGDAPALLSAAERSLGIVATSAPTSAPLAATPAVTPQPSSFANGRYVVKRFPGEGGKKKVYLAHDALLDRDAAFALIETEALDEASRERIKREAQAMGRLGTNPHIATSSTSAKSLRQGSGGQGPGVGGGNPGVETPGFASTQPYLVPTQRAA
jgi:hypothetical protein